MLFVGILAGGLLFQRSQVEAGVHHIPAGTDRISAVVGSATAGDTLMLMTSGGTYHETEALALPAVPLTIMADVALPVSPTWTTDGTRHLKVFHDLVVKGIRFDGRHNTEYAIRNYATVPNRIVVEDCEIAFFTKDGITDNDVPVETCVVRNTLFHDIGAVAIEFRTPDMCRNLLVENCTFYRLGEHAVHINQEAVPLTVRITNITVHDSNGGIYFIDISDAVVVSSIITGCRTYAIRSLSPVALTGICTFRNTRNYDGYSEGVASFDADPRYFDAEAGDFSLMPDSPCLTAGRNGRPLGDLRWTGAATLRAGRWHLLHTWGRAIGILLLTLSAGYGSFFYIRRRVRRQEEQRHQRHLSRERIRVLEEERRRLSRELHDQIGQDLVTLSIQIEMLRTRLDNKGDAAGADLDELATGVEEAIQNIRQISYELRPVMLDDLGLFPALEWYVETFTNRTGLQVRLDLQDMREIGDVQVNLALYRVVQEGVTNTVRHAQATQAIIRASRRGSSVILTIEDNGIGFDRARERTLSENPHGLGLLNIQERVEGLGGSFQVIASPGSGTRLVVTLPLSEERSDAG